MPKQDQKGFPKTDFAIKPEKKKQPTLPGPDRSRGAIDLKDARQTIKKWQAPNRKV